MLPRRPKRHTPRVGDLVRVIWYTEERWVGELALIYHVEEFARPDGREWTGRDRLWLALSRGEPLVLYNREQFSILQDPEPPPPPGAP